MALTASTTPSENSLGDVNSMYLGNLSPFLFNKTVMVAVIDDAQTPAESQGQLNPSTVDTLVPQPQAQPKTPDLSMSFLLY
jgi:hypothetical protein